MAQVVWILGKIQRHPKFYFKDGTIGGLAICKDEKT
jgi:hypothetical protein